MLSIALPFIGSALSRNVLADRYTSKPSQCNGGGADRLVRYGWILYTWGGWPIRKGVELRAGSPASGFEASAVHRYLSKYLVAKLSYAGQATSSSRHGMETGRAADCRLQAWTDLSRFCWAYRPALPCPALPASCTIHSTRTSERNRYCLPCCTCRVRVCMYPSTYLVSCGENAAGLGKREIRQECVPGPDLT